MKARSQKTPFAPARLLGLLAAILAFAIPWIIHFHDLSEAGHRVFAIFLMAVVLWVTEAIPLHATAALIILLNILLASNAALIPLPEQDKAPAYTLYFN